MRRCALSHYTRKRAALLATSGLLVTLGLVLWMNLQVPRTAARGPDSDKPASSGVGLSTVRYRGLAGVRSGRAGVQPAEGMTGVTSADLDYLNSKRLIIPVAGVNQSQLRDSFNEARSEGRVHDAIDIMAPGSTPVLAAVAGTVAKLFHSRLGGITLYEFDKSGRFVFYYAHLSGYAADITEGKAVQQGEFLAYVGDTGNAGAGNFHLHFAISKAETPWKWYGGQAIDPYPLLKGKPHL
ncbi:MAG TPA: M23 family metallopeptidase [Blastocatellia bacterium]|nr:M23 family metallopeptidase [Blastocatellia bacterium]